MNNSKKDYYNILNVNKDCNDEDIKKSYRKLALQFHPDKNPGNDEACEKFKEVSEAYSILSNPEKRKQYDLMGDFDDSFEGEDPFNIFNNIFQQHMNSFMNMKYENDINVNSIFENIPGFQNMSGSFPFGNVHIKLHTFPVDISNNIEQDLYDNISNNNDGLPFNKLFENLFSKKNKSNKTTNKITNKINDKINTQKIIYNKPDTIIYNINVDLAEIYEGDTKKITINRKRKIDGEYMNKKKKIEIPIYSKEIILEGQGDELKNYKEKGDIIINVFTNEEINFKRVNEYDILTFYQVDLNKIYSGFCYELILPNKEVLFVQSEKMNLDKPLIQKINKKGLPYKNDEGENKKGNLYVFYIIKYPNDLNELKNIEPYIDNTNIKEYFHVAYNCNINELFMYN